MAVTIKQNGTGKSWTGGEPLRDIQDYILELKIMENARKKRKGSFAVVGDTSRVGSYEGFGFDDSLPAAFRSEAAHKAVYAAQAKEFLAKVEKRQSGGKKAKKQKKTNKSFLESMLRSANGYGMGAGAAGGNVRSTFTPQSGRKSGTYTVSGGGLTNRSGGLKYRKPFKDTYSYGGD